MVITPDDKVVITGGSARVPRQGRQQPVALSALRPGVEPHHPAWRTRTVGRNYHSEALLLPDGRVLTWASDSLFAPTTRGQVQFEQRIEIYTPPYLHRGERPTLTAGPSFLRRGEAATFATPTPRRIVKARLMRPSAVTHVTDLEQRSVALPVSPRPDSVELAVPSDPALLPDGWYMLYGIDADGIPSIARWVHVR